MLLKIGYITSSLIGVGIVLSVLSHLYFSYKKRVVEQARLRAYQQTDFSPEEIKQDLAYFQDLMKRVHPNQMPSHPLGDIAAKMQAFERSINQSLTRPAFYRQFAPIVSLLNDDHVVVFPLEPELTKHYEARGRFLRAYKRVSRFQQVGRLIACRPKSLIGRKQPIAQR